MSQGPKSPSAENDGSTLQAPLENELLLVTVRDYTRTVSWKVQLPRDTTSEILIHELVTQLKLPSSQANRPIPYSLHAVNEGMGGHRFANDEKLADYLTQHPEAYLVLLPEVTAG
jgi:hypothetical protein